MSDVNWRRAFAVSSLLMALFLIAGSIYLHLRQKHHYGRMRLEQHGTAGRTDIVPQDGVEAADITAIATTAHADCQSELVNRLQPTQGSSSSSGGSGSGSNTVKDPFSISEMCLQCICATATECQPTTCSSSNDRCGIYRISRPYWYDAGKLALKGDASMMDSFDEGYTHCVNNAYCAARTVTAYIGKYARDCNHDGQIDCRDYIALHVLGPSGCISKELMPIFEHRMINCLAAYGHVV